MNAQVVAHSGCSIPCVWGIARRERTAQTLPLDSSLPPLCRCTVCLHRAERWFW